MNNVIIGNFHALHHENHGGTKGTLRKRLLITCWVKDFFWPIKSLYLNHAQMFHARSTDSHQCKIVYIQYEFTFSPQSKYK